MHKLILLPSLVLCAISVNAATQTIPFSFTPNGDVVLTFNKANYNVEDVTSITVSVTMTASGGSFAADNDSTTESGTYSGDFGINASLSHSGTTGPLDNALTDASLSRYIGGDLSAADTFSFELAVDNGDRVTEEGQPQTFDTDEPGTDYGIHTMSPVNDSDSDAIASSQYSKYLGEGTYTITISASQFSNGSGVGGVATSTTPADLIGSVTVTVVPEPSAYAAILGALVLCGAIVRRRK